MKHIFKYNFPPRALLYRGAVMCRGYQPQLQLLCNTKPAAMIAHFLDPVRLMSANADKRGAIPKINGNISKDGGRKFKDES